VDVDLFKAINDQHGHAVGDQLLSEVARRLQGAIRNGDMVGRIGGDEFLIVCPEIGGREEAMKLPRRLAEAQHLDVSSAEDRLHVQVSIGVAWSSGECVDADALVAQADKAIYESKRQGVGRPELALAADAG
jgi:diguanylate cyclase (GGDEF)-like protein